MTAVTVLVSVLLVVASVLCAVAIWAVTEFVKTAKSLRTLSVDLDVRLVPLLDKADVTVDATNAELLRIDAIVTRMEEVTDRVSSTSRTVQEVANAPAEIVSEIADRMRHAWRSRRTHSEGAESSAESPSSASVPAEHAPTEEPATVETRFSDTDQEPTPEGGDTPHP